MRYFYVQLCVTFKQHLTEINLKIYLFSYFFLIKFNDYNDNSKENFLDVNKMHRAPCLGSPQAPKLINPPLSLPVSIETRLPQALGLRLCVTWGPKSVCVTS